jgi:hypothetical protein
MIGIALMVLPFVSPNTLTRLVMEIPNGHFSKDNAYSIGIFLSVVSGFTIAVCGVSAMAIRRLMIWGMNVESRLQQGARETR